MMCVKEQEHIFMMCVEMSKNNFVESGLIIYIFLGSGNWFQVARPAYTCFHPTLSHLEGPSEISYLILGCPQSSKGTPHAFHAIGPVSSQCFKD